jgi:hypothetical protein
MRREEGDRRWPSDALSIERPWLIDTLSGLVDADRWALPVGFKISLLPHAGLLLGRPVWVRSAQLVSVRRIFFRKIV